MGYEDLVRPENIEKGIWATLLAIEAQAVLLVPVDGGGLRNSVSVSTNKRDAGFNTRAGTQAPEDAKIQRNRTCVQPLA